MPKIAKTFLLIVSLTALIWAWAEQSQIATLRDQTLELRVRLPANSPLVIAHPGAPANWTNSVTVTVTASFAGPQSGMSELARMIERQEYPPVFTLPAIKEGEDKIELNLGEVLRGQPILGQLHAGVSSLRPEKITLTVGKLEEYKLDVVPAYSDMVPRQAECKPDKVAVRLPRAVYDKLEKKVLSPVVQVGPSVDLARPQVVALPTDLDGYPIQPAPRSVTVVTNVGMKDYTVPNVPILGCYPRDFPWREYDLTSEKDQWRKTVVARGPIDRTLAADDIQIYLKFQPNDWLKPTEAQLSRDVDILLPPGFVLVSPLPKEPDRAINFSFVKRGEERTTP